ncbi:MAG: carboxypeptidase-like regulatory domain-containing protein, partial [Prevotellaceae bacterium]|nr:carboxypeptidase-like regulatory domain-containing protein [Prevotellaceae bacterium]
MKRIILVITMFLFGVWAHAQNATVTGTVADAQTGETLVGVTVVVKGTTINASTNVDGKFSINVSNSSSASLVFSYVGYKTSETAVNGRTAIDVQLESAAESLREVVVTALGMTRNKKALGYAMTEIKGEDIVKSNLVNPVQGLQGKVAGVQINMGAAGPQSSQ